MRKQSELLTWAIVVVLLLTTSSLAIYYRNQAVLFQQEYQSVLAQRDAMTAAPVASREEVKRRVADVSRERETQPILRRDREPDISENAVPVPDAGVTNSPRAQRSDRFGRRATDWMENLRTNDPPRFAELQQRRQQMQETMQTAWAQANDYFMNRDTSRMNQADLAEYTTMIKLLGQASTLSQQLQSGLPSDLRQQVASELRSNVVAVAPLLENERNREYYDAALALGHNDQDAAALVTYINQIASNTSLRVILPGVRGGGPSRGGGPPSGPPGP